MDDTLITWIAAVVLLVSAAFVLKLAHKTSSKKPTESSRDHLNNPVSGHLEKKVEQVFNQEFREELKNRGRLYFEKIISENAMFLQQDLRLTTSQLNDFMKKEITRTLEEEFAKYATSIADAKQLAIDSITKTQVAIEEQRTVLSKQLEEQVNKEREQLIGQFENNMADIINHYVTRAIGEQIDLSDQLEYILGEFEDNKKAIIEDLKGGA